MKYPFSLLIIASFFLSSSYALDMTCFQNMGTINSPGTKSILYTSNQPDIYPVQDENLLHYKLTKQQGDLLFDYDIIDASTQFKNLEQRPFETGFLKFDQYDTEKHLIIKTKKTISKGTFNLFVDYQGGTIFYQISKDGKTRRDISEDISNYDLDYLKINFSRDQKKESVENVEVRSIKIGNISTKQRVIKSNANSPITLYSNYNCNDEELYKALTKQPRIDTYFINATTPLFTGTIVENPNYNTKLDSLLYINDIDHDGVLNSNDNCPNISNPDQKDSNADGMGDLCSDDDGDSIIGYLDNCPLIRNPDQKDVNQNTIGDACEFDKDQDGIADSIDNCITKVNPEQKDSDSDGIGDDCDNCNLYNPSQRDTDQNGKGDRCEEELFLRQSQDQDKDGILDGVDTCITGANQDQLDSDLDGVGDICDNCITIQNKNQEDLDGNSIGDMCEDSDKDGIVGYTDNCIAITNPDQADSNNNGIGNLCEDEDRDTIIFAKDNCPFVYNPDQKNIDGDKEGDACDSKDNRYVESNKPFFIAIACLFIVLFAGMIAMMGKKLREKEKTL